MVDARTDDSLQLFANVLKKKMPEFMREAVGAEELPLKRDMWGEPVKQTPEGANPFLYNFLDFTRTRSVPSDETNLALYKLWKETGSEKVLPSVISWANGWIDGGSCDTSGAVYWLMYCAAASSLFWADIPAIFLKASGWYRSLIPATS